MGDFKKANNMILKKIADKLEKTNLAYLFTTLFIIAFIVYFFSLFNGFVWDDEEQIVNNAIIQNISNFPYLFTSSTFNTGGAGLSGFYYKPLMPATFSLINSIFGLNSFFFHFFDLSLHLLNACLIFLLFKKIFNLFKYKFSKTFSFLLSVIFLVHPASVESVVYISSTQELLYVFFILLSLLISLNFLIKKGINLKIILLLNLLLLLAVLSKESGIMGFFLLTFLVLLVDRTKIKLTTLSFIPTLFIYFIFRFAIAKTPLLQQSSIIPIANASLSERFLTIPFELISYLRLIFFPLQLFVAQHIVIKNVTDPNFYLPFFILIIFIFVFWLIFKRYNSKLFLFFIGWIFFSFFVFLNIYPLDMTIAERWLYGPLIGILGLTGYVSLETIKRNTKTLPIIILFILLFIVFFSIRSFIRTFNWNNNLSLFSHDIKYNSNSFDAQNNLGVALFRAGKSSSAKVNFEKSINLSPKWWTPYNNLGVIYQREGNISLAKKMYLESIRNGNYYLAYENLAQLKSTTENPKEALSFVRSSLSVLPYNENLNRIAAQLYFKTKQIQEAKDYANRTYQINPSQENYILLKTINEEN
jgi:protein O-mannosyl-transferase